MARTGGEPVEVRALGHIEAGSDGRTFALGGATQQRVFAVLLARRGEVVDVSTLVEACWPDGAPPRAEHNVRTYVHRLRTSMDGAGERIETLGSGYRLRVDADEVDLDRYEQFVETAVSALTAGDAVAALDALGAADELWRGRPYAEFAEEPWAMAEANRMANLRLDAGERRAEALLRSGRPSDAVGTLEQLVREDPYRETPRALLMRALYEAGRQTEALRTFQEFRQFLIDDAGVQPSAELADLDRRIASGSLDTSAAPTIGGYELHERIGEGAFAVVHRAVQTSLRREVAIKIVRAELANRPEFIRRFEAEAQMVASIEHPNVVPLYDYWREPGNAYLIMRWMTGGSLETRLDAGTLDVDDVVDLVDRIASALDAAHAHDIVHRDVKPANILFDEAGRALLGDFGIALAAAERSNPHAALSEGSPDFASPEQLRRRPAGPEADVHALGIVAFVALTGRTPFHDAADDAELLRRQLAEPVPALSSVREGLPTALDDVIAVATAKEPTDRYPTAGTFAAAFRAAASGQSEPPVVRERVNPYVGLRPFGEADAALFHGRDRLVDELVDACAEPHRRFVAVVGASGSGKSSVVRAGLIPALRADRVAGSAAWFLTTMVPGGHPYEALETALLRVAPRAPVALLDQLRDGHRGILRAVRRIVPDDDATVVVILDQFEELFTATDAAQARQFLAALATAVTEPGGPLRVVATMRADFYDQPLRHVELAPLFKRGTVAITPLAPDELEEAITAPATAVGVGFEPGLVAEIIADVNSQPGALPMLQYALTRTFDATDGDMISAATYHEVGGLTGALSRRAETLYDESNPDQRRAVRQLLCRLVNLGEGTGDTRRRVRRIELPEGEATDQAIERFGRARLLTLDRDPATREPTVEIAHEALIREWPRLRTWLDTDRDTLRAHRHLTATAAAWVAADRDSSELYRGARLEAAEALRTDPMVALNEVETEFVDESARRRDGAAAADRARVRRLRLLVAATTAIAVVAAAAGTYAIRQRSRADTQAEEAVAQATAADRALLDADAEAERRDIDRLRSTATSRLDDPVVASLLAVEAYRTDPSVTSLRTLHHVMASGRGFRRSMGQGPYAHAELLGDGTSLVALGPEAIELWDLGTGTLERSIPHDTDSDRPALDVGADDRTIVAGTGGRTTYVYDLVDPGEPTTIGHDDVATSLSLSGDSTMLAAATDQGVEVWDLVTGQRIASRAFPSNAVFVRWNPVEDRIAVVDENSDVHYWDPADSEPTWVNHNESPDLAAFPASVLFSSDGKWLVVESSLFASVIRTIDVAGGGDEPYEPIVNRSNHSFSSDASYPDDLFWVDEAALTVGDVDRPDVAVRDLTDGSESSPLVADVADPEDLVYSAALDRLVTLRDTIELYAPDASGPLEVVVPFVGEFATAASEVNGTIYTDLAPDGSRITVSADVRPFFPAPIEADLGAPPIRSRTTGSERRPTTDPAAGLVPWLIQSHGGHTIVLFGPVPFWQLLDRSGTPQGDPVEFDGSASVVAVSPDGRFVAFGLRQGLVDLYTGDGELVERLDIGVDEGTDEDYVHPSFNADGSLLAAVAEPEWETAIWDTSSLERLDHERPDDWRIGALTGDWYTVSRDDGTIARFDPRTLQPIGAPIGDAPGHRGFELDAANQRMATTSDDAAIVWDLGTGEPLSGDMPAVSSAVRFTEDGALLSVPGRDRVTLWNFDTDTWADIACDVAGRNLTRAEWEAFGPRTIEYRATCDQYDAGE